MKVKKMAAVFTAAVALAVISACGGSPDVKASKVKVGKLIQGVEPKVTAYIRTWPLGSDEAERSRGIRWTAEQIHGEYLEEIIIAFGTIDQSDKSTIIFADLPADGSWDLWGECAKLKQIWPHLRQNLSIGGWGAEFSDTAADPALRAALIANISDYLRQYNLDGADIDWEYPVGPDWGQEIKSRPEDRANYIALLTELRAAMDALGQETGKRYGLSACVPAGPWWVTKNDAAAAAGIVDNLKLMAYDYYGGWSATTGHLANLYANPADPAGNLCTVQAVDTYLNAGVPAEKIVLGFAFYGRAWRGVGDGGTNGLYQKYEESAYPDGLIWPQIKELLKKNSGYTRHWDDVAHASFLYNGDVFISYTDEQAIKDIAAYAQEKGLGGVMVWEYAQDINGDLFKVLNDSIQ
ncbi:MAG: glycoside hydrolase family 18 protein [Spirochaetaceae bacterium]|jgi:chitinase|nr:glycoside hydrolase family 18 protein [Spirochaetaceae bacterium]